MYKVFLSVALAVSLLFSSEVLAISPIGKGVKDWKKLETRAISSLSMKPVVGLNDFPVINTPRDYEMYLEERGKTDQEALEIQEQFSKLSAEKKKKFMYYINNPQIMLEVLNTPIIGNSKKELYNGDIIITQKTTIKISRISEEATKDDSIISKVGSFLVRPVFAAPGKIYDIRVEDVKSATFFGLVTQFKLKAWVAYKSKDKVTVVSVQAGNGSVTNWYPFVKITKDSAEKYVHGNKAITEVVWKFSAPISPYDVASFNQNHHILGFPNGTSTYRYFNG